MASELSSTARQRDDPTASRLQKIAKRNHEIEVVLAFDSRIELARVEQRSSDREAARSFEPIALLLHFIDHGTVNDVAELDLDHVYGAPRTQKQVDLTSRASQRSGLDVRTDVDDLRSI